MTSPHPSSTDFPRHLITWLSHAGQRLGLVPSMGGGVVGWQLERGTTVIDLWRPWDGINADMYSLASFAMVPWTNRISGGGFEIDGRFYPIANNRKGEPYPIHGNGWLQPWALSQPSPSSLEMTLESHRFGGDPYEYQATQLFRLVDGGLDQTVTVTHLGAAPLPYGIGLHPWYVRGPQTRLQADVSGVWLCGDDPIPTSHTQAFPATWNLRQKLDVNGSLIDNTYTGWSGESVITWPEHHLALHMRVPQLRQAGGNGFCLLYRAPEGSAFCFEPVTHPIDAFHLPGRPGLKVLAAGESLKLHVEWRFAELD